MEKDVCDLKHEAVDKHLELHDKMLDHHGDRLDKLEIGQTRTDTIVENLCKQIESLVVAIKWLISGIAATGMGFIVWYIQSI